MLSKRSSLTCSKKRDLSDPSCSVLVRTLSLRLEAGESASEREREAASILVIDKKQ